MVEDFNTQQRSLAILHIDEQQCFRKDAREFEEVCTGRIDYRRWYLT